MRSRLRAHHVILLVITKLSCATWVAALEEQNGGTGPPADPQVCPDKSLSLFEWGDYLVVAAMLVISIGIGIFFCIFDKSQSSADFLNGGGNMGTFPMAMSLASGFITAIELLGNPAEMYTYGTQFWMTCLSFLLIVPITGKMYLPVYMKLKLTSCYEYLELRFNSTVRTIGSLLYIVQMMLYTSVAVYAPALALSNVTGLNVYVAVTVIYVVCVFYSSQGGMKAVIITDSFQASCLVGSIICVLALGSQKEGGFLNVLDDTIHGDRIELFNMDPDPTVRHSFWTVVIGGTFYWASMFCSNQATIQKYLSVETLQQAQSSLWISAIALVLIYTLNFGQGMLLYSTYKGCDPQSAGDVSGSDELLPLYVMQTFSKFKGVAGFFVAGIFAASLGTVAAALNSLAAVTLKDFIAGAFSIVVPDEKGAIYGKWISLGFGLASFALIFIVEQLGSVLQIALSFNGMIGGVTLGLFTLGMMVPWANSKGAIIGSATSFVFVMWIGLGATVVNRQFESRPISVEACPCVNSSVIVPFQDKEIFGLYKISYLWYTAIGCLLTVAIGAIVSWVSEPQDTTELNHDLLSPPIARMLENKHDNSVKPLKITQHFHESRAVQNAFTNGGVANPALDMHEEKLRNDNVSVLLPNIKYY